MLILKNVRSGYVKNIEILKGIDLHLHKNETIAIIGQNGAGKSTLAKTILNLINFKSGEIIFKSKSITDLKTEKIANMGIGYFMQGGRIFPHLTVEENLNFAGINLKTKELIKRKQKIKKYFSIFYEKRLIGIQASYLSGGEKHQLALAMVLMKNPKLLILDEPSAGLSPANVQKLYEILSTIKKNENIAFIVIEQNVNMALNISDTICLLKNGVIEMKAKSNEITLQEIEELIF